MVALVKATGFELQLQEVNSHNAQIGPLHYKGTLKAAVLLLHGFTGTPDCMRYAANHLHDLGFSVSAPLLAGHGATKERLAGTRWQDWYTSAQTAFLALHEDFDQVFVAGLSLGGLLTLKLAQDYPQNIHGVACLATPVFLHKWVTTLIPLITKTPLRHIYQYQKKTEPDVKDPNARRNYWNIHEMPISCIESLIELQKIIRHNMARVLSPTLIMHSRYDSTAPYESMAFIAKNISARTTETITLENSFHLITIDYDRELVNQKMGEFFARQLQKVPK